MAEPEVESFEPVSSTLRFLSLHFLTNKSKPSLSAQLSLDDLTGSSLSPKEGFLFFMQSLSSSFVI